MMDPWGFWVYLPRVSWIVVGETTSMSIGSMGILGIFTMGIDIFTNMNGLLVNWDPDPYNGLYINPEFNPYHTIHGKWYMCIPSQGQLFLLPQVG